MLEKFSDFRIWVINEWQQTLVERESFQEPYLDLKDFWKENFSNLKQKYRLHLEQIEEFTEKDQNEFDVVPNLAFDLYNSTYISRKVKRSDAYAQNLYAALCNNDFQKLEMVPILKDLKWHCSWRSAGGIVSDITGQGDYMEWYCSGMAAFADYDTDTETFLKEKRYVAEGVVTPEIEQDLKDIGWIVIKESEK